MIQAEKYHFLWKLVRKLLRRAAISSCLVIATSGGGLRGKNSDSRAVGGFVAFGFSGGLARPQREDSG